MPNHNHENERDELEHPALTRAKYGDRRIIPGELENRFEFLDPEKKIKAKRWTDDDTGQERLYLRLRDYDDGRKFNEYSIELEPTGEADPESRGGRLAAASDASRAELLEAIEEAGDQLEDTMRNARQYVKHNTVRPSAIRAFDAAKEAADVLFDVDPTRVPPDDLEDDTNGGDDA